MLKNFLAATGEIMPRAERCEVFWSEVTEVGARDLAILDGIERDRLARFRRSEDRNRFATAAVLLRRQSGLLLGTDPGDVWVRRACAVCGGGHGKPTLPGTDLFASVTHAGDLVGVALTRIAPVGIDIERYRVIDLALLRGQVLGPGEIARSSDDFLRYWTRKEALTKATGDGIGVGLSDVRVTAPTEVAGLLSYPRRPGLRAQVSDLDGAQGYVASIAILTDRAVRFRESHVA
ncbi:MAG: 4'-phosphopantetheinyl transferase superfamily protein [Actinobacteria bacterium]|nr:4'-phosphopantetheinyl transferase superfamily protein [Actinomycetota bacterium]